MSQDMVLFRDRDGNPIDVHRWAELFGDIAYRFVARTAIDEKTWVSTIWEGSDRDYGFTGVPILFETAVLVGGEVEQCWHWSTLDQAIAGHDEIVAQVVTGGGRR